jgi:hypothetical protein
MTSGGVILKNRVEPIFVAVNGEIIPLTSILSPRGERK